MSQAQEKEALMQTDFEAIFRPYVADATRWYSERVLKKIDALRDADGVIRYPGGRNAYSQNALALRYLRTADGFGGVRSGTEMKIAEDFLAKEAARFGEDQVAGYIAKLRRKVDGISVHSVKLHNNGAFTLRGNLGNDSVRIDQQVVFKVSSKGTFFLQWPARIYLRNKFITEKAFRALVEEGAS